VNLKNEEIVKKKNKTCVHSCVLSVMRKNRKNAKTSASSPSLSTTTVVQANGRKPRGDSGIADLRRISGRKSIHLTVEEELEVEKQIKMATDSPKRSRRKRGRRRNSDDDQKKTQLKQEQESIVLWRKPLITLYYFVLECFILIREYAKKLLNNLAILIPLMLLALTIYGLTHVEGAHRVYFEMIEKQALWCGYWIGLGILSSVGLGTGLHTFLLYLGPHIARVTLAAYECGTTDFPEPPYPSTIECPDENSVASSSASATAAVTLWSIMSKVRIEACMWGAGTAIGELPPYFMARAARLSGKAIEDEDFEELEELLEEKDKSSSSLSLFDRAKLGVHSLIQRVGFFGILACASIPNPLFDLAGITCGHFLVPFWTFFGATLIGKAIIKMHIQQIFVILLFTKQTVEIAMDLIRRLPKFGPQLQQPLKQFLESQKAKLHKPSDAAAASAAGGKKESLLGWVLEKFVLLMVVYFVVSIVNSMAQSYHKRIRPSNAKDAKTQKL